MFSVFKHGVNATLAQSLKLRFNIRVLKLPTVRALLIFSTSSAFKLISVSPKP